MLTQAGLLDVRRDGNRRIYRLRPEGLAEPAEFLQALWADRLDRLKRAAEREQQAGTADQDPDGPP